MRVAKAHPLLTWLRLEPRDYSRALDQLLIQRDRYLQIEPDHSGPAPGFVEWVWQTEVPQLLQKERYRAQFEEHRETLELGLLAIDSDILRNTASLQQEKQDKQQQIDAINAALGES